MARRLKIRDFKTALNFDGSTSAVTRASSIINSADTAVTITAWVYIPSSTKSSDQTILGNSNNNTSTGFSVRKFSDGRLYVYHQGKSPSFFPKLDSWNHYVFVIVKNIAIYTYENGVAVINGHPLTASVSLADSNFEVGRNVNSGGTANQYFRGLADNVQIYRNLTITQSDVDNLYYDGINSQTPTLEWKFDEGSGTTANDSSGNGNTGTITGATYTSDVPLSRRFTNRSFGTNLVFNGTSNKVTVTNASLGTLSQVSIATWVKARTLKTDSFFVTRPAGTSDQLGINNATLNKIDFALNIGGNQTMASNRTIQKNVWYHIVGTYDGTNMRIYINGKLDSISGTLSGSLSNTGTSWEFGSRGAVYYDGLLDNVGMWSTALTLTQIEDLYYDGVIPTGNILGSWFFDEGSGTSATDSSGNNIVGTITGATYGTDVTSVVRSASTDRLAVRDMGSSLRLNGNSGYVDVGNVLNFTSFPLSISGWIKPSNVSGLTQGVFGKRGNPGDSSYQIYLRSSGQMGIYSKGSSSTETTTPNNVINKGVWSHFVVSVSQSNVASWYINGTLVASSGSSTLDTPISNTSSLFIGKDYVGSGFAGLADDMCIWNTALTSSDAFNIYINNVIPVTGLVGRWKFDEGSGTTAFDSSSGGNNGTITGATYTSDVAILPRQSV